MNNKEKFIQVIGFLIVIILLWKFAGLMVVAITAIVVAIWEFLKPSN